ncbi:hypothetical protein MC885_004916, partial [Smutsia gigantea]
MVSCEGKASSQRQRRRQRRRRGRQAGRQSEGERRREGASEADQTDRQAGGQAGGQSEPPARLRSAPLAAERAEGRRREGRRRRAGERESSYHHPKPASAFCPHFLFPPSSESRERQRERERETERQRDSQPARESGREEGGGGGAGGGLRGARSLPAARRPRRCRRWTTDAPHSPLPGSDPRSRQPSTPVSSAFSLALDLRWEPAGRALLCSAPGGAPRPLRSPRSGPPDPVAAVPAVRSVFVSTGARGSAGLGSKPGRQRREGGGG